MDVLTGMNNHGAYMYSEADCPYCGKTTNFRHIESVYSPAKVINSCTHAKSYIVNDDGVIVVTFAKKSPGEIRAEEKQNIYASDSR